MSMDSKIQALIVRVGTDTKSIRTMIAALPAINDTTASASSLYSASKIEARITAAATQVKSDLTNGAGSAMDTLKEISDALGGDANFATTIMSALAKRLRVDAVQAFTEPEKLQARTNIDVWSKAEVGAIDTDYVAAYNTAIT